MFKSLSTAVLATVLATSAFAAPPTNVSAAPRVDADNISKPSQPAKPNRAKMREIDNGMEIDTPIGEFEKSLEGMIGVVNTPGLGGAFVFILGIDIDTPPGEKVEDTVSRLAEQLVPLAQNAKSVKVKVVENRLTVASMILPAMKDKKAAKAGKAKNAKKLANKVKLFMGNKVVEVINTKTKEQMFCGITGQQDKSSFSGCTGAALL